jgi:FlaA1/EpsC-like NDP-sugar epimerase
MRPGEKLHEELSYPWEVLMPTEIDGVRFACPVFNPRSRTQLLDALLDAVNSRDAVKVRRALMRIVPEFEKHATIPCDGLLLVPDMPPSFATDSGRFLGPLVGGADLG